MCACDTTDTYSEGIKTLEVDEASRDSECRRKLNRSTLDFVVARLFFDSSVQVSLL